MRQPVQPETSLPQPNEAAMLEFLEHVFSGDLDGLHDGLIEIAYTDNQNAIKYARLFGTDELEDAAAFAASVNRAPGCNAYVGMALRRHDAPRDKRASKQWFHGTVVLWNDWDEADELDAAKEKYKFAPPTAGVITGRKPAKRGQAFWRLSEAMTDPVEVERALAGMQGVMGGDPKVIHADGVMRLPGSVSWPKPGKEGRVAEVTTLHIKDVPPYLPERLTQLYSPKDPQELRVSRAVMDYVTGAAETVQADAPTVEHTGALGLEEKITDGRESYMRDTVLACLVQFIGETGCEPDAQDLFDLAWPQYSRKADLTRPGRGKNELMRKCVYTASRFRNGRISGLETLEKAVEAFNARPTEVAAAAASIPSDEWDDSGEDEAKPFSIFDWTADAYTGEAPEIEWLCQGTVQLGVPMLMAAMGGLGKSFICLDMGLSIAAKVASVKPHKALGGEVVARGTVVILSAEDSKASIHRRLNAIDPDGARHRDPRKLIVVPMPDAGGPQAMIGDNAGGLHTTPFFERLVEQLKQIDDLRLVIIDPLQAFVHADVTTDPAAGQYMWSAFARLCSETGATMLVTHHMRKDGMTRIQTADDAREAIRGSTALVDGARATYALWKVEDSEAEVIARAADVEPKRGCVVRGCVVKVNDEADTSIHTYVRQPSGLLMDRTDDIGGVDAVTERGLTDEQIADLQTLIREAWDEGNPYSTASNTGPRNIYKVMAHRFGVSTRYAQKFILDWDMNGVIKTAVRDTHSKQKGLKLLRRVR